MRRLVAVRQDRPEPVGRDRADDAERRRVRRAVLVEGDQLARLAAFPVAHAEAVAGFQGEDRRAAAGHPVALDARPQGWDARHQKPGANQ